MVAGYYIIGAGSAGIPSLASSIIATSTSASTSVTSSTLETSEMNDGEWYSVTITNYNCDAEIATKVSLDLIHIDEFKNKMQQVTSTDQTFVRPVHKHGIVDREAGYNRQQ